MEIKEAVVSRRSVTKYLSKKVRHETLSEILDYARYAPSSGNLQNWQIIIVEDKEKRKQIANACLKQLWMIDAPVHLVICNKVGDVEKMYGKRGRVLYSIQNCAAIAQTILLLAKGYGLDSCWVGAFDVDQVRALLNIPDDITPEIIITLGYSTEKPSSDRYDLDKIVYFNEWGNRLKP